MRSPKDFFSPLAVGAPEPVREIPFRPSRMIHFFPPHLDKVTAKLPAIAPTVDVLLGNLEDAIPMDAKEAAPRGARSGGEGARAGRHPAVDAGQQPGLALGAGRPDEAGHRDR